MNVNLVTIVIVICGDCGHFVCNAEGFLQNDFKEEVFVNLLEGVLLVVDSLPFLLKEMERRLIS